MEVDSLRFLSPLVKPYHQPAGFGKNFSSLSPRCVGRCISAVSDW